MAARIGSKARPNSSDVCKSFPRRARKLEGPFPNVWQRVGSGISKPRDSSWMNEVGVHETQREEAQSVIVGTLSQTRRAERLSRTRSAGSAGGARHVARRP